MIGDTDIPLAGVHGTTAQLTYKLKLTKYYEYT